MADSYIQVAPDSSGKKMQTYLNTIVGSDVHAEGVVLVDSSGNPITTLPVSVAANLNIDANSSFNLSQIAGGTVSTVATGIQLVGIKEVPDATSTYAPSNSTSTAYVNNAVIKGSSGVLFNVTGYNSKSSSQYILLFNATSLPGDGNAPNFPPLNVPAGQTFSLDFGGKFGRYFSSGIVICNSSTANTKTIGSADCWFDAVYS